MTIKPVDMQVMIPKTSEVAKINSDEQHKNQMLMQNQAKNNQDKVDKGLKKVHSQDKVNETKIREKQEKDKQQKKKKKDKEGSDEDLKGGSIDIKL